MPALQRVNSVLSIFAKAVSSLWKSIKTLVFVLLVLFFIASHLFTGLAVLTSTILGTVFQTTTALTEAKTLQKATATKLKATESDLVRANGDLKKSQAKITNLEAKSLSQADELRVLRTQNRQLSSRNMVDFRGKKVPLDDAVKSTVAGLQTRTKKVATANVASAAGESIPFYGIAIIVAATTYELKSACDTMRDLHDLQVSMDPKSVSDKEVNFVCGLKVPSKEELWEMVKSSPLVVWESAVTTLGGSVEWVKNLETPDFSGAWSRSVVWFSSWFE